MDDAVNEAMATRAVPITVALSAATYFAIREGFLKVWWVLIKWNYFKFVYTLKLNFFFSYDFRAMECMAWCERIYFACALALVLVW